MCLILFLFATQIIPINWAGVLLIVLAIGLFTAEVKVTSYGLLTVGGMVSMILGAMMLIDVPDPGDARAADARRARGPGCGRLGRLRRADGPRGRSARSVTTGAEGLLGEQGVVETALEPEGWVPCQGRALARRAEAPVGRR